jgi:hypothetical protein
MSRWIFCVAVLCSLDCHALFAVPNREPAVKSGREELRAIDLTTLEKDGGAAFGDWAIWRYDQGGESYFLINQKTGLTVYLYWGSNGWVNYRTKEGMWFVFFPTGAPQVQDRRDLNVAPFLDKQPTVRIAPGKYTVKNWTITVTGETIEFFTPNVNSRLSIRRTAPEFTHNNRAIGGK